jgi:two-component system phosphate regulon sensor histidine kinase PhoR
MSKRNTYLIAAGVVVLAIVLLPSLAARAFAAALLLVLLAVFLKTQTTKSSTEGTGVERDNAESSQEVFALGKLFEATMNGMREGLLVVDKDMKVVASNTAAHRLFNLSRGKLDAQRLTELTRNPAIYGAFLDALKGTERSGVKVETHGPDRLVFDLRTVPLSSGSPRVSKGPSGSPRVSKGPNGSPRVSKGPSGSPRVSKGPSGSVNGLEETRSAEGALGVFIDITRLERLEQVRQEFLSNVSHELRTPLTAILAFIETLEAGAIDDQEASQRFLAIIRRNAIRMQELIDDILELSAIESGNVRVRAEVVELAPIVTDVIASLATNAFAKGIIVTSVIARDALVYADARRLEQMLTNLVENAIKFNRENGTVTIKFESEGRGSRPSTSKGVIAQIPQNETPVRDKIIIEDTGEGIPAQHVERLFERFYRVDRARSRDLGGIGLGLAIVKHLARAHGGEVTVSSELGKGSTFTIELPLYSH